MRFPRLPNLRNIKLPKMPKVNFSFRKKPKDYLDNYPSNYPANYPANYPTNYPKYKSNNWESYYLSNKGFGDKKPKRKFKTLYQVLAAGMIFFVVLSLRETDHPAGVQAREGLKYMLTTEWNFQPAMDKAVQLGLQAVNMNMPFFNDVPGTSPVLAPRLGGQYSVPVSGQVTKEYGWIIDSDGLERFNPGIFISSTDGANVKASRAGKVVRVGEDKALGTYVLIEHGNGDFTMYAGLGQVFVEESQQVQKETAIGQVGKCEETGTTGLHFEIRENNKLIDPLIKLQVSSLKGDTTA